MKLRNKKTGEVVERTSIVTLRERRTSCSLSLVEAEEFSSIEQLNKDWEDYEPVEPLIKDEKIRKAVRAWADADGADEKIYLTIDDNGSRFANKYGGYIEFAFQIDMEERLYTIAELCGEEEE